MGRYLKAVGQLTSMNIKQSIDQVWNSGLAKQGRIVCQAKLRPGQSPDRWCPGKDEEDSHIMQVYAPWPEGRSLAFSCGGANGNEGNPTSYVLFKEQSTSSCFLQPSTVESPGTTQDFINLLGPLPPAYIHRF